MDAKELRQFGADELKGRVRTWREELFRSRFKGQTSEARDTSVYKKLKRDIARALTILNQKVASGEIAPQPVPVPKAKPVAKAAKVKAAPVEVADKADKAEKAPKAKTTKKKKSE